MRFIARLLRRWWLAWWQRRSDREYKAIPAGEGYALVRKKPGATGRHRRT